jgi:hypothetical protein
VCGNVANPRHDLQSNISKSKDNVAISENCQAGGKSKINRYKQVEVNNSNVFWQTERRTKKRIAKMNNEYIHMLHGVNGETSGTYRPLYPVWTPATQHLPNPLFSGFCDGWLVKTAPRCESNGATRIETPRSARYIPVTSGSYLEFKQPNDESLYWLANLTVNIFREMQK